MNRPGLLIFDCDGVLIDSEIIQCRVDAAELTRLGYKVTPDELARRFVGFTTRDMRLQVEEALGRALPDDFEAGRNSLVDAAYRRELKAIAGIREVVGEIGLPFCVASNARTARLRLVLELVDLLPLFGAHMFGADMVARPKPAPDLFLLAARRMGFPPSACLVIEDSVTGVRAAAAAGMPVLGFCGGGHCFPGYEERLLAAGAGEVFRDMRDLPALAGIRKGRLDGAVPRPVRSSPREYRKA